jgi:cytochrome c553
MNPKSLAAACLLPLLGTALAQTTTFEDRQTRAWAATCAACHGTDGRGEGSIPAIAGKDAEQSYRALLEFKNNQRPAATVMHQHAKGYTDDELKRLAQYYSRVAAK